MHMSTSGIIKQSQRYEIEDDALYLHTVIERDGNGIELCKSELVMTREAFVKCYKAWIEGDKSNEQETD